MNRLKLGVIGDSFNVSLRRSIELAKELGVDVCIHTYDNKNDALLFTVYHLHFFCAPPKRAFKQKKRDIIKL